MADNRTDQFSAGAQGLGYLYQPRLALLELLQLPEDTSVFVEKDDDLEFVDALMLGAPVHQPDWWQRRPDEDAVSYMFRVFPVTRPH